MKQTTITKLIANIDEIIDRDYDIKLTMKGFKTLLCNALNEEKLQLEDAFDNGVKYGNSTFQTFDFPFELYYNATYTK